MEQLLKRTIMPLFSKPVFSTRLENIDKSFLKNIKFLESKEKNGFLSENLNILKLKELTDIRKKIQEELDFYIYDVLRVSKNIRANIIASWITLHKNKFHKAPPHTHANSALSGCFYLKASKNCGRLYFLDQQSANLSRAIPFAIKPTFQKLNIYNSHVWPIDTEEDLLLIFPSDLAHATEENESGQDRYCLAFDILLEGDFYGPPFENTKKYKVSVAPEEDK